MLLLWPQHVLFGTSLLRPALALAINRSAAREALAYSDLGPTPVFADVPEERTEIKIILDASANISLRPGDDALLSFSLRPNTSEASVRILSTQATLLSLVYDLAAPLTGPAKLKSTLTLTFLATSANGLPTL